MSRLLREIYERETMPLCNEEDLELGSDSARAD